MIQNFNISTEEANLLDWCYSTLTEEQAAEVEEEAAQIAAAEIHAPEAAERLLPLLVKLIVGNARQQSDMR